MPKSNRNCAVGGCSHTQRTCPKGRFVGFPNGEKQPERRALWIGLVQRGGQWTPTKNSRVCGCHFTGGYKVDDPSDPAYNPSIFPATPELDRRVRKTMMEEMYMQKVKARHQRAHLGLTLSNATLQPAVKEEGGEEEEEAGDDDIMKFVSAALDLSKEAGEEYASAIRSERDESKLRAALLGTGHGTEVGAEHVQPSEQLGGPFRCGGQPVRVSPGGQLIVDGQLAADGGPESVPVGPPANHCESRQTFDGGAQNHHGWLYDGEPAGRTGQAGPPPAPGNALNLSRSGSGEGSARKRKSLHPGLRPQSGLRCQRFALTNRRLSGSLSASKHPRHGQTRVAARATAADSASVVDRAAEDSSSAHPSERKPPGGGPSRGPQAEAMSREADCRSQASVQTLLSFASPWDGASSGWDSALNPTHGRCPGFHGWSDVCLSETTVRKVTGLGRDAFGLLLGCLPEVVPALPAQNSLLLLLMKLKMAVPFEFLASVFNLAPASACNIFTHTVSALCDPLRELIRWPSDQLLPPAGPRNCPADCSIVIDFLIIRTERPLTERESELSSATTGAIKVLLGLLPNGTICFVSSAYSGSATNADILTDSSLLDGLRKDVKVLLLQHDETVERTLTGKGFSVLDREASPCKCTSDGGFVSPHVSQGNNNPNGDTLMEEDIKLEESESIPLKDSAEGLAESICDQLKPVDVPSDSVNGTGGVQSQQLAHSAAARRASAPHSESPHGLKMHRLRSFNIFNNCVENEVLLHIDKVVAVCAALNNLTEPVT